jgi:hypothetical protein
MAARSSTSSKMHARVGSGGREAVSSERCTLREKEDKRIKGRYKEPWASVIDA